MVEVFLEVRNGTACFGIAVQARSTQRAMGVVVGCYLESDVGVGGPVDPECYFEDRAARRAGPIVPPDRTAA